MSKPQFEKGAGARVVGNKNERLQALSGTWALASWKFGVGRTAKGKVPISFCIAELGARLEGKRSSC